jgi:signal transduction histidine kinase
MNLMLNSIEVMRDAGGAGNLTITSRPDDSSQILISVSGSGTGIPPDEMKKLFKPFFSSKSDGTGMGLPISRFNY